MFRFSVALAASLATIAVAFAQDYQDSSGTRVQGVMPLAFVPNGKTATPLSATTSSSSVSLPYGSTVLVQNTGANAAYVTLSTTAGTATISNVYIPAGASIGLRTTGFAFLNAITASGTTTLNLSGGVGILAMAGGGGSGGTLSGSTGSSTTDANGLAVTFAGTPPTGFTVPCTGAVGFQGAMDCLLTLANTGAGNFGSTLPTSGVAFGLRATTAEPTAATDGQFVAPMATKDGKLVNVLYAPPELWNQNGGNDGSGVSSAITILAASGSASLKEYLRSVHCGRDDAGTTAVRVAISDGTTTRYLVIPNSGGGGGNNAIYDPPLAFAANTSVTATPSASVTGNISCDGQGFNAP